jgi:hypothetical protein
MLSVTTLFFSTLFKIIIATFFNELHFLMKQDWSNEKEQFSPVSILDCPFQDEEEMKSHSMINSFFQGHSHIPLKSQQQNITNI